ncbi:MAG TPA: palindromic element RPE4 domain-containing protein [Rickettsia endosymbiont of Proechinophthirus fluctus]|nr:palindromic element RPE4 domain-containing protein [Rickettsia endosymbiont of Proechinophthirus fluctus]
MSSRDLITGSSLKH